MFKSPTHHGLRTGAGLVEHPQLVVQEPQVRALAYPAELLSCIQARTVLGSITRQVSVTHYLRFREQPMQGAEQIRHRSLLLCCHRVAGKALLVQSALIADTYAAFVEGRTVRASLQWQAVLRLRAIPANVEVVPHIPQVHCLVVPLEHLRRIVLVAPRTRAVQHQKPHVLYGHQINISHNRRYSKIG